MNGTSESSSSSPKQENTISVAAVTSTVTTSIASAPDLPLVATCGTDSPGSYQQPQPQTSTPPPPPPQISAPVSSQRPSVIVTLPNQIPVVTNTTNPIVFATATTVPSGSVMIPSSGLIGNAPVSIIPPVNFPNGSVVTVAMENISKPSGAILTSTAPLISASSTPVIQSTTSVVAGSSIAVSSQPSRHESPQLLQIPAVKSKSLQEIIKEVDPYLQLDEESEEVIRIVAEEFLESVAKKTVKLAKHRGSVMVEPRDVKHVLEHHWDMTTSGFPASQDRAQKRPFITQAHKQHLALLQKQVKRS